MTDQLASASMIVALLKGCALTCFMGTILFAFLYGSVRPRLKLAYKALEKLKTQNAGLHQDLASAAKKVSEQERVIVEMRTLILKAETKAAEKSLETARNRAIRKKLEEDGHRKNATLASLQRVAKVPTLRQVV